MYIFTLFRKNNTPLSSLTIPRSTYVVYGGSNYDSLKVAKCLVI